MSWNADRTLDPIPWLLNAASPVVRYLALRDVLNLPTQDAELQDARQQAHRAGPIATVLEKMHPDGYWVEPGPGYYPKYTSSVWSIILLAELGATVEADERIAIACAYLLEHTLTAEGVFSVSRTPSGTADCLQGNLCWALTTLGCCDDRLELAYEWMARTVTGEGLAPLEDKHAALRYYAGKCGPTFACGSNNKLPCAWGAAKVMLAFGLLPESHRTPLIQGAIQQGVDFLFSVDPATANYPNGWTEKPSRNWWLFGFPVFYVTDLLQIVEALAALGYADDPRLGNAWQLVCSKQDAQGRWLLEYDYTGKTWLDFGSKKQPNPWVTIRALRALSKREGHSGL
jgi:hypothetical protein